VFRAAYFTGFRLGDDPNMTDGHGTLTGRGNIADVLYIGWRPGDVA